MEQITALKSKLKASQAGNPASMVAYNDILKDYHEKVDEYNELLKCVNTTGKNKSSNQRKIAKLRKKNNGAGRACG